MHRSFLPSSFVASYQLNLTPRVQFAKQAQCVYSCAQTKQNKTKTGTDRAEPDELCVPQGSGARSFLRARMLKVFDPIRP